jgi:ribonuclease HI
MVVTRGWENATLITTMSEAQIVVFTDGASKGNPGPGAWGVIIATPDGQVTERGGGAATTTNNRMELTGAIAALTSLEGTAGRVSIYTDSTYVIQGIREWMYNWKRRGWKTATGGDVMNRDLWERLDDLVSARGARAIAWHYVRGHHGVPGNERGRRNRRLVCDSQADRLVQRPAVRLPSARPGSAGRDECSSAQQTFVARERGKGRRLFIPQRRRWQADAPPHLEGMRAAGERAFRRTVQESRQPGGRGINTRRVELQIGRRVMRARKLAGGSTEQQKFWSRISRMLEGRYDDGYLKTSGKNAPKFTDIDMKIIGSPVDFVGINVYIPLLMVKASEQAAGYQEVPFSVSQTNMFSDWHRLLPESQYWSPRLLHEI